MPKQFLTFKRDHDEGIEEIVVPADQVVNVGEYEGGAVVYLQDGHNYLSSEPCDAVGRRLSAFVSCVVVTGVDGERDWIAVDHIRAIVAHVDPDTDVLSFSFSDIHLSDETLVTANERSISIARRAAEAASG